MIAQARVEGLMAVTSDGQWPALQSREAESFSPNTQSGRFLKDCTLKDNRLNHRCLGSRWVVAKKHY
ncbi:hypothetical protein SynTAK9802_00166 [Synechococcus sp. TAK9802]|nr:hypothetical protein SynTAK9802_00166 [Synechococcus sp. TAK9802]